MPKTIKLNFRAKLPDDTYFYQERKEGRQHLTSFLRRVLLFWKVTHPTYLKNNLEDILEIEINGKWVKCK